MNIRNFAIIAHIDHGKSTLADRFLELTKTVEANKMKPQYLDQMELERERGVTIKLAPVTMNWQGYILNLIDTPGHVDFNYEVSRSLAAVEGVILLVDASQGIQAQTVTNLRLALEQKLVIIPVLNKIDLSGVDLEARKNELAKLLNINKDEILLISAKTGQGVERVLEEVIKKVPEPQDKKDAPLRALIFDSIYSEHKGVVAYVRIVDGEAEAGDELEIMGTKTKIEAIEVGIFQPQLKKAEKLSAGLIGYIMTGLKNIQKCRVGDTITKLKMKNEKLRMEEIKQLPGYKEVKPMVFSSLYNQQSREARKLGEALEKLKLNDASLSFEPESSVALGFGFRCGFLGLFHLEIIKERLKREYGFEVIATRPSVAYNVWLKSKNEKMEIHSPEHFPTGNIEKVEEPIMNVKIITPPKYLGNVLELIKKYHGQFIDQKYLVTDSNLSEYSSLIIEAKIPLAMLIVDFYDKLKNVSAGYASMSYDFAGYEKADLIRLDILLAGERQEAFSSIVYQEDAVYEGRRAVEFLKGNLPRQMFEVKIQAVTGWQSAWKGRESGGKIIASERLPAMRKDVTAKLYGGDVTRKNKLLKKQKKGKKKMMAMGKVDVPSDIYIKMLRK
jgi:GTP-binding protein LepA